MAEPKTTKLSLANTPVRRALARARKSTLLILLLGGFVLGWLYRTYLQ